jgi:hypothetical protein
MLIVAFSIVMLTAVAPEILFFVNNKQLTETDPACIPIPTPAPLLNDIILSCKKYSI